MKIAFFEIEGWEESHVRDAFPGEEVLFSKERLADFDDSQKGDIEIAAIFVNTEVSKEELDKLPNLKLIVTRSTGFDHIDLDECKKRRIVVGFVPGYGNNTVAEFAFSLILNLTRKTYLAIDQIKESGKFSYKGFRGIDLKGKTFGVIGTGRIGKEAIHMAKGFGMYVVAYDPYPNEESARDLDYRYVSLEELLKISDVVSLHAPYNEKTHHVLNKKNIPLMKKGAYLINTARGGLVETDALVRALKDGALAGAGLDVLEEEGEIKDEMMFFRDSSEGGEEREKTHEELQTIIQNHILMRMPNVLITPHNAFNTQEALERILFTTIKSISDFAKGELNDKYFVVK